MDCFGVGGDLIGSVFCRHTAALVSEWRACYRICMRVHVNSLVLALGRYCTSGANLGDKLTWPFAPDLAQEAPVGVTQQCQHKA
jgi:hypothetical protein